MRVLAYPFTTHLAEFVRSHDRVYVIDQNRDAQLLALMRLELEASEISKLSSVRYYGGMPLDARTVTDQIVSQEEAQ
jgi:2-oxoglutarate ferredoxin oxidoreductase subunit alpha